MTIGDRIVLFVVLLFLVLVTDMNWRSLTEARRYRRKRPQVKPPTLEDLGVYRCRNRSR